jgi:hypothetical protein
MDTSFIKESSTKDLSELLQAIQEELDSRTLQEYYDDWANLYNDVKDFVSKYGSIGIKDECNPQRSFLVRGSLHSDSQFPGVLFVYDDSEDD